MTEQHESYGNLSIAKFTSNGSQFFGSDLVHGSGVTLTISTATRERRHDHDWVHADADIIEIELSSNQFVDAITSGMNTQGVPCTIKRREGKSIEPMNHVRDREELFTASMKDIQIDYQERIDAILKLLDGNVGKRKADAVKFELGILKSHISSNTPFVLESFKKSMNKTVSEAKHSVANYIDSKVQALGIKGLKQEFLVSLDKEEKDA